MIKKDPIDVLIEKTDHLIGLTSEVLAELRKPVMKRIPVQDGNRKARKVAVKKEATGRTRRFKQFPTEMYRSLRALGIGEEVNITTFVRNAAVPMANVKHRLLTWAWTQRNNGNSTSHYAVEKRGWDIFVKRVG